MSEAFVKLRGRLRYLHGKDLFAWRAVILPNLVLLLYLIKQSCFSRYFTSNREAIVTGFIWLMSMSYAQLWRKFVRDKTALSLKPKT